MPDAILEKFIDNYLNINSAIITLVTIGLITIITIVAYSLETRIRKTTAFYKKFPAHLIEGLTLGFSMVMLQQIFRVINKGSINNAWLYANAQLTILLFCMYLIRNKVTLIINILMPLMYYGSMNIRRLDNRYLIWFAATYIFLIAIDIYIYHATETLQNSEWKYLGMQLLFGLAWWIMLWVDHSFPLVEILNMLVVFLIYMSIIRYCEKKLQDTMLNYDNLKVKANYDELTGIRNRANLDKTSDTVFETYSNSDVPLTLAMFDIDRFKSFNDEYGHSTGDEVLRHVAHTMERQLFLKDTQGQIFRFGGEEFIIIFRGKTPTDCTPIVTDLRDTLLNSPLFLNGEQLNVSVSFGVSQLEASDHYFSDLFDRVDDYLYQSKKAGRNRMTIEGVTYDFQAVLE